MITCQENRVILKTANELTWIEPYGPNCLRCRSTRNSRISDESWTLQPPMPLAQPCTITRDEKTTTIVNGDISAVIENSGPWFPGRISYYRKGKPILRTIHENDAANAFIHTEGDHYRTTVTFDANPGEHLYGLGQEQQDYFDRKGCAVELLHRNTKFKILK